MRTEPARLAAEALRVAQHEISAVEHIKGGLTNESWLVRTADDAVVVRISTADEQALRIDRNSERLVLEVVQRAGLGAEVLLCLPQRRVLVTRYLPGEIWTPEQAREGDNIGRIATLLRGLHAVPAPRGTQTICLTAILDDYWRTLDRVGSGSAVIRAQRERAQQWALSLAEDMTQSLCHNDVHHLNIVDHQGQLRLLDWEYAGVGDPYFDLAAACCYHGYDLDRRRHLLQGYLGCADAAAAERLDRMCWLFDYIGDLWMAVRQLGEGFGTEGPGYTRTI